MKKFDKKYRDNYKDNYYIYIITHPKFGDWIKIGRTNNLQNRLNSYQTGCPNREYKLEYSIKCGMSMCSEIETYFKLNIHNNGYEWFKLPVKDAILIIDKITTYNNQGIIRSI